MNHLSPERPQRRGLSRRQRIVSSDDEENTAPLSPPDRDFSQASAPSTAHRTTRTSKNISSTGARSRSGQDESMLESSMVEPATPLPSTSRQHTTIISTARRSVRAARKSRQSVIADAMPSLPTPPQSKSPEPAAIARPLTDITESIINEQPTPKQPKTIALTAIAEKPTPMPEKPMDIVLRARARADPLIQDHSEPKPRMVMTYLILTNFKSYAGRQEVGPFHASFSSVVGPNGSGKSNVIDSLLFVFGFRASKMRQGKVSALIHNSAAFPDLNFCEVEVHFQEVLDQQAGTYSVVPGSSLVISRRAFKNNSSKYYINGAESNFTTVTTLLRERGVDLDHKRFLILQGEVESIAQMKPKAATEHDDGLLEYLEDIIGTSKYKTPIEESALETETLNTVCIEKLGRVQHVEKEKQGLESKKDLALAYIKDENDLAMKQSALYQVYTQECDDNIQVANEAVETMQSQLEEEAERHRGNEKGMQELEKRYASEKKQFERLENSAGQAAKGLAQIDKETVKLEEKRKHLNIKAKKLDKTRAASQAAAAEAEAHLNRLADDIERNTNAIEELQSELISEEEELATVRSSLAGKTQGISDQIAAKQKSMEPWTNQINQKRSAIAVAQSELAIIEERNSAKTRGKFEIQSKITHLESEKERKSEDLEKLKEQKASLTEQSREAQALLDKLTKKEPDARLKLSSARQKADEARASLSQAQNQGNVLTGLMRLKESGRIQGFHGRLGNLGTIDERYDVAISTACPSLDNMIVDSVEVGQQCIEYLRKNNMGRANFICLDKLSSRDLSSIDTPENVPRLYDLVRPKDDSYRAAFYSVLQNTVVAKDLSQANRIAYGAKRWRVVTLDGQLIDKSGTMTGGGTRVRKGAMSSKITSDTTKEQMSRLEADQSTLEQRLEEVLGERQSSAENLRMIQNRLPDLDVQMQKCMLELQSTDRDMADARRRATEIDNTTTERNTDGDQKSKLEKSITTMQASITKLQEETTETEEEIKSLQDKIMEIGGVKLRGQKAKVDGLRERISTLTEEVASAEITKVKNEKLKIKHSKTQNDAKEEGEGVTAEVQQLENEAERQIREAAESRKQAEDLQDNLESKKEEMLALKLQFDEKTAELNQVRAVEIEMRNKLEEHTKTLTENRKRLSYWQEKLNKLALQDVEGLESEALQQDLVTYSKDELLDFDKNALKGEIAVLEERTQNANIELGVLSEYRRRVEELAVRSGDLAGAVESRDTAKRRCEELRRLRLQGFMEGFSTISLRLKEMYQMITMGGNAELELVDSLDPFSEGILFSVMPPKKSWKNISNLSGGEKTLSSLALVFALHHYKPTPLYVMDEIDAALDFRNVSIVASYIKERTKNAQFIVISLRNNMFELASRLIGVYKVNHMTKSVTVENRDYINRQS